MRNFGGLGLGLYVARQIVEAHGGEISLVPDRPRGAQFVIRLPRSHVPGDAG
jgi:signal transduction histidine kinase